MSRGISPWKTVHPHGAEGTWNRTLSKLSGEQHAALPKRTHQLLSPDPPRFPFPTADIQVISNYSSDTKAETLSSSKKSRKAFAHRIRAIRRIQTMLPKFSISKLKNIMVLVCIQILGRKNIELKHTEDEESCLDKTEPKKQETSN